MNAIHLAAPILDRLAAYEPASVQVDGLVYREGLNAVGITGGVAGNVIPDECMVHVNYRFAPSRSPEEAVAHIREEPWSRAWWTHWGGIRRSRGCDPTT